MNPEEEFQEPLNNVELESAILGLRMALTPEEEDEARQAFLQILRDSPLAVPTAEPAPTNPDGSLVPGADIQLIVVQDQQGQSGVPAFTSLGQLRATLQGVPNGMFLNGAQLGGILSESPLKLFVDGPDMHAEVSTDELRSMAASAQAMMDAQQAAAQRNVPLEAALEQRAQSLSAEADDAVVQAFLGGFARVPILTPEDGDIPALVLTMGQGTPDQGGQTVPLLVQDGSLMCFTNDDVLNTWRGDAKPAIALPGGMIAQMSAQSGVPRLRLNPGTPSEAWITVQPDRLIVSSAPELLA